MVFCPSTSSRDYSSLRVRADQSQLREMSRLPDEHHADAGRVVAKGPLLTLLLLVAVTFLDLRILAALLPSVTASLRTTSGTVGLAMTSQAFAFGTGQLLLGPLGDRLGRVRVMRVAALGFGASVILSAAAHDTIQFVAARMLVGAFSGAIAPLTIAFIGDTYDYELRQAALGRMAVMTAVAFTLSVTLGGLVTQFVSWRAMLVGIGALGIALSGRLFLFRDLPPIKAASAASRARGFAEILSQARARRVYTLIFLEGILLWGSMNYLGTHMRNRYGLGQFATGNTLAVMGLGMILSGLSIGRVRRAISERGVAAAGGACLGIGFGLLVPVSPLICSLAGLLVIGAGSVALISTLQARATALSGTARGTATSLFALSRFLGFAIGAAVMGRIFDHGFERAGLAGVATALAIVGAVAARPS
jgi:predicted MFS family arabinose efflux permease